MNYGHQHPLSMGQRQSVRKERLGRVVRIELLGNGVGNTAKCLGIKLAKVLAKLSSLRGK